MFNNTLTELILLIFVTVTVQSKSSEKAWNESDIHRDMEQWKQQQLELHKVLNIMYIVVS